MASVKSAQYFTSKENFLKIVEHFDEEKKISITLLLKWFDITQKKKKDEFTNYLISIAGISAIENDSLNLDEDLEKKYVNYFKNFNKLKFPIKDTEKFKKEFALQDDDINGMNLNEPNVIELLRKENRIKTKYDLILLRLRNLYFGDKNNNKFFLLQDNLSGETKLYENEASNEKEKLTSRVNLYRIERKYKRLDVKNIKEFINIYNKKTGNNLEFSYELCKEVYGEMNTFFKVNNICKEANIFNNGKCLCTFRNTTSIILAKFIQHIEKKPMFNLKEIKTYFDINLKQRNFDKLKKDIRDFYGDQNALDYNRGDGTYNLRKDYIRDCDKSNQDTKDYYVKLPPNGYVKIERPTNNIVREQDRLLFIEDIFNLKVNKRVIEFKYKYYADTIQNESITAYAHKILFSEGNYYLICTTLKKYVGEKKDLSKELSTKTLHYQVEHEIGSYLLNHIYEPHNVYDIEKDQNFEYYKQKNESLDIELLHESITSFFKKRYVSNTDISVAFENSKNRIYFEIIVAIPNRKEKYNKGKKILHKRDKEFKNIQYLRFQDDITDEPNIKEVLNEIQSKNSIRFNIDEIIENFKLLRFTIPVLSNFNQVLKKLIPEIYILDIKRIEEKSKTEIETEHINIENYLTTYYKSIPEYIDHQNGIFEHNKVINKFFEIEFDHLAKGRSEKKELFEEAFIGYLLKSKRLDIFNEKFQKNIVKSSEEDMFKEQFTDGKIWSLANAMNVKPKLSPKGVQYYLLKFGFIIDKSSKKSKFRKDKAFKEWLNKHNEEGQSQYQKIFKEAKKVKAKIWWIYCNKEEKIVGSIENETGYQRFCHVDEIENGLSNFLKNTIEIDKGAKKSGGHSKNYFILDFECEHENLDLNSEDVKIFVLPQNTKSIENGI